MTPTQLTLRECRDRGWPVDVCERTKPSGPVCRECQRPKSIVRVDLFGFADLIALTPDGILAIQATSKTNMAARRRKITRKRPTPLSESDEAIREVEVANQIVDDARRWLACGGSIAIWGWTRSDVKINRRNWLVEERPIAPEHFEGVQPPF